MCYGIQVYGNHREMAGAVRLAQRYGFSISETIMDIMADHLKEKDAKDVVEKTGKRTQKQYPNRSKKQLLN
ncbi:MAG: hypothetical protein IJ719_02910 [Clostridia bacterium]|nr:hypothetical protein [Clostridia bacterium]